jgi:peptide chain release factor 1
MAHETPRETLLRLQETEKRFDFLTAQLSQPEVVNDRSAFQKLSKERAQLETIVLAFQKYRTQADDYRQAREILEQENDPELRKMAQEDIGILEPLLAEGLKGLELLLLPRDPNDDKNIVLEVRAGVGGDEAGIFASDLARMYAKFAETRGLKVTWLSVTPNEAGGFKEANLGIEGDAPYSAFKYETGVHRVQRVPKTEASGRIHTSTATVAALPEAEEVDVTIRMEDIRMDVYRASGAGGQHVNKTESAVRLTHVPTNTVVACQAERSQLQNREKAMKMLRSKLYERAVEEQEKSMAAERRSQVGTGMRNERIRTYNFPQGRVTDHRIGMTTYNIDHVIAGDLDAFVKALADHYQTLALRGEDMSLRVTSDGDDA